MLTLDLIRDIELQATPVGQILAASTFLRATYNIPGRPTKVSVEGLDRIPRTGAVYLAMNHTDRFNYWPLQYTIWRKRPSIFTATWVKGKYYNNPWMGRFMVATNNIPTPSRGYLLVCDAQRVLGHPPADALYRLLRDTLNDPAHDLDVAREAAAQAGVEADFAKVLETPRDMLGVSFKPSRGSYFASMDSLFSQMMGHFVRLNEEAFGHGHKVIVFPEGTRSLVLTKGRPGLAQMALRTGATIVPIGCNGSDDIYPGDSPISRGGHVVYRVGEPLTPGGELAPFQIDAPYVPFTAQAEAAHGEAFAAVTDLVMERIAGLVDARYLPGAGQETAVSGASRFL